MPEKVSPYRVVIDFAPFVEAIQKVQVSLSAFMPSLTRAKEAKRNITTEYAPVFTNCIDI